MTETTSYKFPGAKRAFLAANSPSYFLRKLRSDPDIQKVATTANALELITAIGAALKEAPVSLDQLVVPYALLAALAVKGPRSRLEEVMTIPSPHHEWFTDISTKLVDSWKTTLFTSLNVSQQQSISNIVVSGNNTTSIIISGSNQ